MADTVDSGDYTSTDKYRRAIALALLKQGFGQHGRAGGIGVAADAVSGLVSGYMLRGADLDEKEANSKVAALLAQQPGFSSGTTAPVAPPSTPGPTNKMPGMSDLIDPADGKPVNAGVVPYASGPPSDFRGFVEKQEGFNPKAYPDYKQTSIGFGTRGQPGETITREEAGKRLDVELSKARQLVQSQYPGLSQKQEDALTDLTYNAGNKWMDSGLGSAVKAGNWPQAQSLFQQYNRAGGQPLPGLTSRRQALAPWLTDTTPRGPTQTAQMTTGALPDVPGVAVTPSAPPSPAGVQTAQALPTPQPTPQQPPASQPGAQAGPSAEQVGYYQKLVAEAKRTGNPKITQMAMQYRAQVEAQLQKEGTNETKEFEFGKTHPGFYERQLELKRAGATAITNDLRAERAHEIAKGNVTGKAEGEREVNYENIDAKAHTKLGTIALMRQGMKDPNFFSGGGVIGETLAPAWKRFQVLYGGDPNAAASVETFGALSKQQALEKMGGSLGTGFSNADRDFVVGQVPGLANTPAGNAALLDVSERIEKRNIEVGRMYRAWKKENKGASIDGFKEYMMDWEDKNPVFSQDDPIFKAAGEAPATSSGKFSNPNMKPGEWQTLPDGTQVRKRPK